MTSADLKKNTNKIAIIWLLVLLALIGFAGSRLAAGQITVLSDLLSLVGQHSVFDQKIKQTAQRQQQKLIIVVAASQQTSAQQVSGQLTSQLSQLPSINTVSQLPFNSAMVKQITGLYADYPLTLLNDDYAKALATQNPDQLTESFLTTLLQPGNPFVDLTITQDPTLALANALQQKLASQSQWLNDGNALYQHRDGLYYYPLFIELSQAGFGVNQSVLIEQDINQLLSEAAKSAKGVTFYRSGLLFHISGATTGATNEIRLFGLLSSLIILAATFWVFRSLKPLLVVALIIVVCIAFGTAGLFSVVDEVHLLTFIFAVSLIGIGVDYAFHVLSAAALNKEGKSLAGYLAPAMLMGSVTTIVGYCGMLLMPMAALHQITVFMIFGLVAAIVTALVWLAPFYSQGKPLQLSASTRVFITALTDKNGRKGRHLMIVVLALLGGLALGGGQLNFDDNIRSLNSSAPELLLQEHKVQQLMGYSSYPRYIVVSDNTEQALLSKMAVLDQGLQQTLPQRQFQSLSQSISQWIPSVSVQQQQKAQFKSLNLATMQSYIEPSDWQTMTTRLDHHLTPAQWPTALALLAQPLWQDKGRHFGMIRYFAQLTAAQQNALAASVTNVEFFDQPQRLSQSLASVRGLLSGFFVLAGLAFTLILVWRYGFKQGLLAVSTPLLAALGSLLISQLMIGSLSIFNLLACLLIIALAVDYSVFFNEQGHKQHVVLAVLLSALSSGAAFGMMMFSQTPAVYHFGLSTFIGILLAVLLAFITPLTSLQPLSKNHDKVL